MSAPWWDKVTDLDRQKAEMYRDAALAHGIPPRPHGLFPPDDKLLKDFNKAKHILPFEKHILFWDAPRCPASGGKTRAALHADEGYTHGDSACIGRGFDFRYFWDSSSLKVVAAVRYSLKAVGGWSAQEDENSPAWGSTLVHGGCVETIMDELTVTGPGSEPSRNGRCHATGPVVWDPVV